MLLIKTQLSIINNCSQMRLFWRQTYSFCKWKLPYNINFQEHAPLLKKIQKASKDLDALNGRPELILPRRKRRVYDRPRIDLNIKGYSAWRLFTIEDYYHKFKEHCQPVVAKVFLQPKWMVHAFGIGCLPNSNPRSSHREYVFEDNNLSKYLLYQYRNTTSYKPNDPNWDYENQQNIFYKKRKTFRLSPEQFWKSDEKFEFRINATYFASHHKFKHWIEQTVEQRKKTASYDEYIDSKFGEAYSYNRKQDIKHFVPSCPYIMKVNAEHFLEKTSSDRLPQPKIKIETKLGEEYRVQKPQEKQIAQSQTV